MTSSTDFTEQDVEEVHALAGKVADLVRQASSPAMALNALLTAYINTADKAGVLAMVPGAGLALGAAAEQLMELRRSSQPIH